MEMRKTGEVKIDRSFIGELYTKVADGIAAAHPSFEVRVYPGESRPQASLNILCVLVDHNGVVIDMQTED